MSSETKILKKSSVQKLIEILASANIRLMAPQKKGAALIFAETKSASEISYDHIQTDLSAKSVLFPQTEEILSYSYAGRDVNMKEREAESFPELVLFGARPCESSAIGLLNAVFTWDTQDVFFKTRLAKTTVITIGCKKFDEYCFCTSVGCSPADKRFSDIFMTPVSDEEFYVESLTKKGDDLIKRAAAVFTMANKTIDVEKELAKVPVLFDIDALNKKLPDLFNRVEIWKEQSLRCLGCGACAYACPACACFDIQDESGKEGGKRLRCWDSCGFSTFTLHTSGHNPRHIQAERWRQRVMHKFSYFKDRLKSIACVGCGRCSRNCPVDMNLSEHLKSLMEA